MSKMLRFFDRLLSNAANLERLGLVHQACQAYGHIADMRQLPAGIAEQTQARLGEIHLEQGRYAKARKHLTIALTYRPDQPDYHFLLARACGEDPAGNTERATDHFRRCLELDSDNAEYLMEYARHALTLGRHEQGLTLLRRALEVAGDDPVMLADAVELLREQGEMEEAQSHARLALFRHPHDPRFRRLWHEHQFRALCTKQQAAQTDTPFAEQEPRLLPFVPSQNPPQSSGRILRKDPPAAKKGPHLPTPRRLPRG